MPQTNYTVTVNVPQTRTVREYVEKEVTDLIPTNFVFSDSMIGALADAKEIARQLGAPAIKTEHVLLAIATRKTPKNVTTTGGKILREQFGVTANGLAAAVVGKAGASMYSLSTSFGGYR